MLSADCDLNFFFVSDLYPTWYTDNFLHSSFAISTPKSKNYSLHIKWSEDDFKNLYIEDILIEFPRVMAFNFLLESIIKTFCFMT